MRLRGVEDIRRGSWVEGMALVYGGALRVGRGECDGTEWRNEIDLMCLCRRIGGRTDGRRT